MTAPENSYVYKLSDSASWSAAERAGSFAGSVDDLRDGFIHFSTAEQARATAEKHFSGLRDLIVAAIATDGLGAALKWEPSRGGALFPHLYEKLEMRHVAWVRPLPLGADGRHVFPPEMT